MGDMEDILKELNDVTTEHILESVDFMDCVTVKTLYKMMIEDVNRIRNEINDYMEDY